VSFRKCFGPGIGLVLALAACSGSTGNTGLDGSSGASSSTANVTTFCGSLCDRSVSCDNTMDRQTCANACTNANIAVFPKLRSDVVDLMVSCVQKRDCKTVLGSDLTEGCAGEAAAQVAPSQAALQLCDALVTADTKCEHAGEKASCLNTAKLFADAALNDALSCVGKACTEVDACVQAALGATVSSSKGEPGFGAGSGNGGAGDGNSSAQEDAGTATCSLDTRLSVDRGGACDRCQATYCCTQAQDCANDTTCSQYMTCLQGCGSSAGCRTSCGDQFGSSNWVYALQSCESSCRAMSSCP
jgi:hypothetical protein